MNLNLENAKTVQYNDVTEQGSEKVSKKEMEEKPKPESEIRALIKVKIDIYGLTLEDIEDLRRRAQDMITHRTEVTNE